MENDTAFEEQYRGYKLKCRPQISHDRRYLAFLVVTHGADPVHVDRAVTLDLPSFGSEGEAVLASRVAGMRWIDTVLVANTTPWTRKQHRRVAPASVPAASTITAYAMSASN